MEIKILTEEKNVIEVELGDMDVSLGNLIADKLSANKDVEFAACKLEHPIVGKPKLIVRTKKGDAQKVLKAVLNEIKEEVENFKKEFGTMVKG